MTIAVIDYGAGNTQSVATAFKRLGVDTVLTNNKEILQKAHGVIFPGVGHAQYAMDNLKSVGLEAFIPQLKQPVLGICLGFQLMCAHSEEGNVQGLNIFKTEVKHFPDLEELKVPHMGWNKIETKDSELLKGLNKTHFYHVHSYYVEPNSSLSSKCLHGIEFMTSAEKDNFYGVQFHPEKSGAVGEKLLQNFLQICEASQTTNN